MSAGMRIAGALVIAAFVTIGLAALAGPAESHSGHQQKKLFPERWHYQPNGDYGAWMDLSTSDVWLNCDGDAAACGAKWDGPFTSSMADWNGQPMTVRFDYTDEVRDANFDVNVYIEDEVPGGGGGLLGFAPTYDINGVPCSGACVVYSGIVWIGDDAHIGVYDTANDRLATISHEMGHIVSLAHESTNPSETQLYECGMDDTGPIPHSVMSYNCIDPVAIGGFGESDVQPWDTCGVNHAYNDPAFGYSGCDLTTTTPSPTPAASPSPSVTASSTPTAAATSSPTTLPPPAPTATPTPSPTPLMLTLVWGDANCGDTSDPIDALLTLRHDAGLNVSLPAGCPALGTSIDDGGTGIATARIWGDVDCSGAVNPIDSLKVLRNDAGLSVSKVDPSCLNIGDVFSFGNGP